MKAAVEANAAEMFQALSDPTRWEILRRLRHGERCVCDLMDILDAAQSRLSFHLKVLKDAGFVSDRRDGRWVYYTLVPEAIAEIHEYVNELAPRPRPLPLAERRARCD